MEAIHSPAPPLFPARRGRASVNDSPYTNIRRALGLSSPYRIVGGPQSGECLWLDPQAASSPVVSVIRWADLSGRAVVAIDRYAIECDTRRAIFQVEDGA